MKISTTYRIIGIIVVSVALMLLFYADKKSTTPAVEISKTELADKIKGGWAGQIIGCKYGGPTEFKYNGRIIPDNVKIAWDENNPIAKGEFNGLYDDVYIDITFLDLYRRFGMNIDFHEFYRSLGTSSYMLWCGNLETRCAFIDNYHNDSPTSWAINPHANSIDFQIEADFAGLASPALPVAAVHLYCKAGKVIGGGEGYYCGCFVGAMYSNAFASKKPIEIVEKSLPILPTQSQTYAIVSELIELYKKNPTDWKIAWKHIDQKYYKPTNYYISSDKILYSPFNLAYVVIGLLYGESDFEKTMDIATRCGLDSDCNPSTACGILSAMNGYNKIPEKYRRPLEKSLDVKFEGTDYTPTRLYDESLKQAEITLQKYGAVDTGNSYRIPIIAVEQLKFEAPIPVGLKVKKNLSGEVSKSQREFVIEYEGDGIALFLGDKIRKYLVENGRNVLFPKTLVHLEIEIDGKVERKPQIYYQHGGERHTLYQNLAQTKGKHKAVVRLKGWEADWQLEAIDLQILLY